MRGSSIPHYLGVDLQAVWSTVKIDATDLKDSILAILDVLRFEN
jgi:uncharacterized protein with HEPN domain